MQPRRGHCASASSDCDRVISATAAATSASACARRRPAPVVSAGSHDGWIALSDGRWLAEKLGTRRSAHRGLAHHPPPSPGPSSAPPATRPSAPTFAPGGALISIAAARRPRTTPTTLERCHALVHGEMQQPAHAPLAHRRAPFPGGSSLVARRAHGRLSHKRTARARLNLGETRRIALQSASHASAPRPPRSPPV